MNGRKLSSADLAAMTVKEAAAYWFVQRHDEEFSAAGSAEDEADFRRWLAESAAHRQAFERTQSMWDGFKGAAEHPQMRGLRSAALAVTPARRAWPGMAAAAAALAVITIFALGFRSEKTAQQTESAATNDGKVLDVAAADGTAGYATGRNERSTITLSDGTAVSLNLNTALEVTFRAAERRVRLLRGQAFFEVARNPQRPFVVEAADRRIVALGTQFDVRLDPDRVEVVLLEGKVAVDRESKSILDSLPTRKSHVELLPNQRLVAALGEPVAVTRTNAEQATSWRQGWVIFDNTSLQDAVTELNRYSEQPIVISTEVVGNLRLSGVFRIGQPGRFGSIIQQLLPVRAITGGKQETILLSATSE